MYYCIGSSYAVESKHALIQIVCGEYMLNLSKAICLGMPNGSIDHHGSWHTIPIYLARVVGGTSSHVGVNHEL
jgi:hypothetical protein